MSQNLVNLVLERINACADEVRSEYQSNKAKIGIGYASISNLLPEDLALEIYQSFPKASQKWREMKSFREHKYTSKDFDNMPDLLREITFAIQDKRVIEAVESIVSMNKLEADETLYAGGLSMMEKDHFLDPHIDNSHNQGRDLYRRLNLLYYVTPEWSESDGGHLNLWDKTVTQNTEIHSTFNTLVLMETHDHSWHSVSTIKKDDFRCCVSNYYFSKESPSGEDYFHITSFLATPNKKFTRAFNHIDNLLRQNVRKVVKGGLGKKDVYSKQA